MSRRERNWMKGGCYHVTHRCHDGNYYFKASYERDIYMGELRKAKKRYKFDLLDFIITSNHVHLLVYCRDGRELEKAIQFVHGRVGQFYNLRHNRKGSFWSDRFHAVLIESGNHLSECMYYIDYNMMRNGVVTHPEEWKHSGYHELIGNKTRYRVTNISRLLKCLDIEDPDVFREWYSNTINNKSRLYMERQAFWTEAAVVGSMEWIEKVSPKVGIKRRTKIEMIENRNIYRIDDDSKTPEISESQSTYFAVK